MKWLVIGLFIFFLLIILIIITKITILFSVLHSQQDNQINVKFKAWFGLITYKISVPLIKLDNDSPSVVYKEKVQTATQQEPNKEDVKKFSAREMINSMHDMKVTLNHVISLHKIVRSFLKKISVTKVEWHSVVGIGDAALTGSLTGALWAAKGGLIGLISHYFKLKEMPIISITPSFQKAISQTNFQCMIQFRIGYAMLAGIKLVKFWKGGRPNFQSEQLKFISKDKAKSV